jgi:hypothetical protein
LKRFFIVWIMIGMLWLSVSALADSQTDDVLYTQVVNDQKIVYLVKGDGSNSRTLIQGTDLKYFLVRNHILYFTKHQLFIYDPLTGKAKLLSRFNEDEIFIHEISDKADAPDQAMVLANTPYERNLYILEFSDGSIRTVSNSALSGTGNSSSLKNFSPDQNALAIIRQASMKLRFELLIQEKSSNDKLKTSWILPKILTVIPEIPVWSPNSKMLAFYAKPNGFQGFYSLYCYDLDTKELHLIQEQVFSVFSSINLQMGPFIPEWSQDSKCLIFQYQPYGLPTASLILKYDASSGKKTTLTSSRGRNLYPSWSPSGKNILFLSNRDSNQNQVYTIDANGEHLKRLSPNEGYTEWASWYKAANE